MTSPTKYFGTDGIRGRVGELPVNAEFILKLGWALGKVLARKGYGKVIIGKDTRISGYMFESVLEAGLSAAGIDSQLLGPMPTPAIAYLTRTLRAQAGIVISASHNPYYDNGIKIFSAQGKKLPDELELAIEEQLTKPMTTVDSAELGKAVRIVDAPGRYIEFCKSTASSELHLSGFKVVVDCANGAAYHIAPNVFRELGAEVVELGVEPNGLNINLNCGATHPQLLQKTVLETKADLGIALDGDGDRLIMVDHAGEILDGDELLFIIANYRRELGLLRGGVVGTVMSNYGLECAFAERDIAFARALVGDRHVMTELQQRNWQLGGEPSGHIVCLDVTTTGDGIITALQVLSAMSYKNATLNELKAGINKYPQVLLNIAVDAHCELASQPRIQDALRDIETKLAGAGRVLLRMSGTERLVRVMVEGPNSIQVTAMAEQLAAVVRAELSQ